MELKVLLLFLWSCSGPVQSSVIRRYFWYQPQPRTWKVAQQVCRSQYGGDLATVVTDADLATMGLNVYYAWVGLRKDLSVWIWVSETYSPRDKRSHSGEVYDIMDVFASGEPQTGEQCGKVIYSKGRAYGESCDQKHFVFCEDSGEHFVAETMTWTEGLLLCQSQYQKYLVFPSLTHLNYYGSPVYRRQDFPVWIGLYGDGDDLSWSDGAHSEYRSWASGPGPSPGSGSCVAVSSQSKTMLNESCSKYFPSVCYRHNLVLLKEELSWEDAMETCRNLRNSYNFTSFSLLSVEESELQYALSHTKGANTSKVWVGLRFLAGSWFWSDGVPVSLSLPSCPEFACGALVVNSSSLEPTDCSQKLNLLCYGSGPQWTDD